MGGSLLAAAEHVAGACRSAGCGSVWRSGPAGCFGIHKMGHCTGGGVLDGASGGGFQCHHMRTQQEQYYLVLAAQWLMEGV